MNVQGELFVLDKSRTTYEYVTGKEEVPAQN